MFGKWNQNRSSAKPVIPSCGDGVPAGEAGPSPAGGKDEQSNPASAFLETAGRKVLDKLDSAIPESKFKSGIKSSWVAVNAFLESLDEEEEPEPPPEKPLKESVREWIQRWHDREKRVVILKEFGEWCLTIFFRGTVFFFLFALTIWGTLWALDFSENHRIKFFPPDEITDYLAAEHESLEATAYQMTPLVGKDDNIPSGRFDAKFIETVKPVRIYSDEYGIYFMTSKDWYNGEHGIFIAKDGEKMPPDINWGLIEGRIYTYAIYD